MRLPLPHIPPEHHKTLKIIALATAVLTLTAAMVGLLEVILSGEGGGPMPLEGHFHFLVTYDIFHGDSTTVYYSNGIALVTWDERYNQYVVTINSTVVRENSPRDPLVTVLLAGTVDAGSDGWPTQPFDMNLWYKNRIAYRADLESYTNEFFKYERAVWSPTAQRRFIREVIARFESRSRQTRGTVKFVRAG